MSASTPDSISPTFCILPWIQLASKPDGKLNLCCIASHSLLKDETGRNLRMNEDSFEKIWNCEKLKTTRKKMLAGESLAECHICYKSESNNQPSLRKTMNRVWKDWIGMDEINSRVDQSQKLDGHVTSQPISWDLRLSNLCNLQCRMCFPANSHKLNLEYNKIRNMNLPFPDYTALTNEETRQALHWSDSEKFQQSMERALPYAHDLYFTGGEPMIIQATYDLIKKACDLGVASKIIIRFHTNTTVWNEKIMELLPKFKLVDIICSIDGADSTDTYIRYPTKFADVNENFKRYLDFSVKYKNTFIAINAAVSWQNIFDLPKFADWFFKFKLQRKPRFRGVYYNQVYYPLHLSFKMIPEQMRAAAIAAVKQTLDMHMAIFKRPHLEQSLNSFINVLQEPSTFTEAESKALVAHTETLDQLRKQNLQDFIPSAYPVYKFHKELTNWPINTALQSDIPIVREIP